MISSNELGVSLDTEATASPFNSPDVIVEQKIAELPMKERLLMKKFSGVTSLCLNFLKGLILSY